MPAARLDRIFSLLIPFMPMAGGASLREAPVILSETMIFPYLRGLVFCAHLTNDGGWKALDDAYREPPLSTEQILHPEKYRAKPDLPTADRPRRARRRARLDRGRPERRRRDAARRAAPAATAARPPPPAGTATASPSSRAPTNGSASSGSRPGTATTTPASSPGATPGSRPPRSPATPPQPDAFPDAIRRPHQGTIFAVERRGADVAVVEGFDPETTERLVEAAFRAKKTEMTHAPRPKP